MKIDHEMCLSIDSDLHQSIAIADKAITDMPEKAAGTSLESFTDKCSINFSLRHSDNFLML